MIKVCPKRTRSLLLVALLAIALQAGSMGQSVAPAGTFRIAGTVVSKAEGHHLPNARVTLRNVKNPQKPAFVITGDDGRFEFTALAAGKYSITGAKRGFITASYDQHESF